MLWCIQPTSGRIFSVPVQLFFPPGDSICDAEQYYTTIGSLHDHMLTRNSQQCCTNGEKQDVWKQKEGGLDQWQLVVFQKRETWSSSQQYEWLNKLTEQGNVEIMFNQDVECNSVWPSNFAKQILRKRLKFAFQLSLENSQWD